MAGELLVQIYDTARYATVAPAIRELASARRLSESSLHLVREALAVQTTDRDHLGSGIERLRRIAAHSEIDPRVFLSPASHLDALATFVRLYCFDDAGRYDLTSQGGDNWVLLEPGVIHLHDDPWTDSLLAGDLDITQPLDVPSETPTVLVHRRGLTETLQHLGSVSTVPLGSNARADIESLRALLSRALERPHRGIALTVLL